VRLPAASRHRKPEPYRSEVLTGDPRDPTPDLPVVAVIFMVIVTVILLMSLLLLLPPS